MRHSALLCSWIQVDTNENNIRRVDLPSAYVSTLAGIAGSGGYADGVGNNAQFRFPIGVAINGAGTFALIVSYKAVAIIFCGSFSHGIRPLCRLIMLTMLYGTLILLRRQ